jgi:predicted  nucleic acid-binding Zn-ribbon protein
MALRTPVMFALATLTLVGCADLTPIQNDLKDLHGEVSRLSGEQSSTKVAVNNATQSAKAAAESARAAASKSDQALALAQANQKAIDATNEKIDRMFRRHLFVGGSAPTRGPPEHWPN